MAGNLPQGDGMQASRQVAARQVVASGVAEAMRGGAGVAGGGTQCAAAPFNTNELTPEDHHQDDDDDNCADSDIHDVPSLY